MQSSERECVQRAAAKKHLSVRTHRKNKSSQVLQPHGEPRNKEKKKTSPETITDSRQKAPSKKKSGSRESVEIANYQQRLFVVLNDVSFFS